MSEFIIECEYDFDDGWIPGEHRDEIVRCRDCKHLNIVGKCPCGFWALENLNGFCAWGERETINKTGDIVTHDSGGKVVGE